MAKFISWNVASIRARMPVLEKLLDQENPDVVFLQEIKTTDEQFPAFELMVRGYKSIISGQKSFNGVAILSKDPMEFVGDKLPGVAGEFQARYIEGKIGNTHYISAYIPNGNPPEKDPTDTSRLDYKIKWMDALTTHVGGLIKAGKSVVMGGDFNCIERDTDVYNPDAYRTNALMLPVVRGAFGRLCALPVIHTVRQKHPEAHYYSFWDFQMGAWPRNWGMLLDTIFISHDLGGKLVDAGVLKDVRGWEKTSDHAPVWCELR